MSPPVWLLDTLAALVLAVAAVSGARVAAARLPAARLSALEPARSRSWPRGLSGTDNDLAQLLMCIAMSGMLAASLRTLQSKAWVAIFVALMAWCAARLVRDTRVNGVRSLVSGHRAAHLSHSAAMVYMYAARTTSDRMDMTGMGGSAQSLQHPTVARALAFMLVCYLGWDLIQVFDRSSRLGFATPANLTPAGDTAPTARTAGPTITSNTTKLSADESSPGASGAALPGRVFLLSPATTVACRMAMGMTMVFMLLIMI